jgi:Flp pilus assembly protein CpaB
MRRGRIFIYLALIIILVVVAGFFFIRSRQKTPAQTAAFTPTAPAMRYVEIVTAGQNIATGTMITEDMLSSIQIPEDKVVQGLFTNKSDVVNMYAKYSITQGVPITNSMVSVTPGNVNLPGSSWAPFIPQGMTAVAIPITRLSSAGFGIRDGDYVNIIVTMLLVDVDPSSQSALPNHTAGVAAPGATSLTAQITSGGDPSRVGRTELDQTLNQPLYLVPSEAQRPRLVTQMIMQNIQILHVGTFPLPGEADMTQLGSQSGAPTATPQPSNQQAAPVVVVRPDIVTVMVSPQDAVMLTYLIYSGAEITFTLRNPNDQQSATQPDAAMLEYLLTQYNIPVPAKLPYAVEPRLDKLVQPTLPNDTTQP